MTTGSWIYTLGTWLLASVGLWEILQKYGEKGWWGLIPGFRLYRLGVCAGKRRNGIYCLVLELINIFSAHLLPFLPEESRVYYGLSIIGMVALIMLFIFQIKLYSRVARQFQITRWWAILCAFAEWIAMPVLGLSKKYQPVFSALHQEDEQLAGTEPTQLGTPVDVNEDSDGLMIHVRSRTAKDRNGKKRYLLKDINLTIPGGSLVLLLGGSGSGKTTLVNAVTGYEKADADIRLHGVDVYEHYDEMKYQIGFVPQQDLLRLNDTVVRTLEDAALLRLPAEVAPEERKQKIRNVMNVLGLDGREEGLVAKKSGGLRKRISIGVELISDPELFILDEPDSGLDGVIARELFEKLRVLADEGRIVLTITHTPDRVADLFDKVIVLARDSGRVGRLAFYGSPDEARAFFGKDTMEQIVMAINGTGEGGEGRADEFIEKYAEITRQEAAAGNEK